MDTQDALARDVAIQQGNRLFGLEVDFAFKYFEAAELEARTTERYVIVALGGVYVYLAANVTQINRLAWFAPTVVVLFAAARAIGMGWRQGELLTYLGKIENKLPLPGAVDGWAKWYKDRPPLVAISAVLFYAFLAVVTLVIAFGSRWLVPAK
jgi:hypothetical protein